MKYLAELQTAFDASHSYGTARCARLHGHSWEITICFESAGEEETRTAERLLDTLVAELDYRHLNDQLPASEPSCRGIAAWAFERLDMLVPGLSWIRVKMELEAAIVERS